MRQDYAAFTARGAVILVIGPDRPKAFARYWNENDMPFPDLPDLRSRVAARYEQEVNLFKFGRMPALFVLDREDVIRFAYNSDSFPDIPKNEDVLAVLDALDRLEMA